MNTNASHVPTLRPSPASPQHQLQHITGHKPLTPAPYPTLPEHPESFSTTHSPPTHSYLSLTSYNPLIPNPIPSNTTDPPNIHTLTHPDQPLQASPPPTKPAPTPGQPPTPNHRLPVQQNVYNPMYQHHVSPNLLPHSKDSYQDPNTTPPPRTPKYAKPVPYSN